jgi:hypothetical protein
MINMPHQPLLPGFEELNLTQEDLPKRSTLLETLSDQQRALIHLNQANPVIYRPSTWLSEQVQSEIALLKQLVDGDNLKFARHCIKQRLELLYPTTEHTYKGGCRVLTANAMIEKVYNNSPVEKAFCSIVSGETYKTLWEKSGAVESVANGVTRDRWNNAPKQKRLSAFEAILSNAYEILEADPKLSSNSR